MNGKERVQAVLDGKVPDRIPVMMHNFLMAAKEADISMEEFRNSPEKMSDALIQACQKYDLDGIFLDVDTALLSSACGAEVIYPREIAAVTCDRQSRTILELLEYLPTVKLNENDRIKKYLEAINILSDWCDINGKYMRANADQGAFSLACLLVGMEEFMVNLMDEDMQEDIKRLIELTGNISFQMQKLCKEAGCDGTSYGNSSEGCSVVSPNIFHEFALPAEKKLAERLKKESIKTICHICGSVTPILEQLKETGCPAYEIDAKTDIIKAQKVGEGHFSISGNLDPAMMSQASPSKVYEEAEKLCRMFKGKGGFILCSGCALSANTPSDNVKAAVEAVKAFGS